jgi:hypothetical protein
MRCGISDICTLDIEGYSRCYKGSGRSLRIQDLGFTYTPLLPPRSKPPPDFLLAKSNWPCPSLWPFAPGGSCGTRAQLDQ